MVDVKKLQYYLNSPLMKRIVELKESNYTEKEQFDDAPVNYDDAIENYKRLLDITDDVSRNIIEPNSESVAQEGPQHAASLWWIKSPHHCVLNVVRNRLCGRLRLSEYLEPSKLY